MGAIELGARTNFQMNVNIAVEFEFIQVRLNGQVVVGRYHGLWQTREERFVVLRSLTGHL